MTVRKKVATESLSKDRALSKERVRLWLKILKTQSAIEQQIRNSLRNEFDTTLPRFDVMSALDRFPEGLRMTEISGLLKVSNGNVTGIVERLTQDGLALRIAVRSDRRVQRVKLTRKGKAAFKKMATAHEKWLDEILEQVSSTELQSLNGLLDKVGSHLHNVDTTQRSHDAQ